MKIFTVLFFLLTLFSCSPSSFPFQNNASKFYGKYSADLESGEKEIRSWYHYMVSKKENGKYVLRIYYPDTKQITDYIEYRDDLLRFQDGKVIKWRDDGSKKSEYNQRGDVKYGSYSSYYSNGQLSTTYKYADGERQGKSLSYYDNGQIQSEGFYQAGELHGIRKSFTREGDLREETEYKNGVPVNEGLEKEGDIKLVEIKPHMLACTDVKDNKAREACSTKLMLETMYKNIKYPADAREYGIEGIVVVTFIIDKSGEMTDVYIDRGLCESIKKECLRAVKSIPEWAPGMQRGKIVRVQYNLPIKFKLE